MATANLKVPESQQIEVLDEDFQRYIEIAKSLMKSMKRPKDREILGKYLRKCSKLDAASLQVKTNRNEFFKYFLKLLQTASSTQPPQYDTWFTPKASAPGGDKQVGEDKMSSYWSPDKRTYVAAKTISGYGTLVYIATSYKPKLGWQTSGFSSYEF